MVIFSKGSLLNKYNSNIHVNLPFKCDFDYILLNMFHDKHNGQ